MMSSIDDASRLQVATSTGLCVNSWIALAEQSSIACVCIRCVFVCVAVSITCSYIQYSFIDCHGVCEWVWSCNVAVLCLRLSPVQLFEVNT